MQNMAEQIQEGDEERLEHCCGIAVADASCALARALDARRNGSLDNSTKAAAVDQLVRLQKLFMRVQSAGYSLEQIGSMARLRGRHVLRDRLGTEHRDELLQEVVAWPIELVTRAIIDTIP